MIDQKRYLDIAKDSKPGSRGSAFLKKLAKTMNSNIGLPIKNSETEDGDNNGADAGSPSRALAHRHRHTGKPMVDKDENPVSKRWSGIDFARPSTDKITERSNIHSSLLDDEDFKLIDQAFPHIGQQIAVLWGSDTLEKYIGHLFLDTREGTRQGFPPDISLALFRLQRKHDQEFPHPPEQDIQGWDAVDE